MTDEQQYPMHAKLGAIQSTSQSIYEFLEWLGEQGLFIAKYDVRSDTCRNCRHDRPHRTELENHTWVCDEDDCGCDHNDRGNPERIYMAMQTKEALLAEHFEIDLKVLEEEKQHMLDAIRELPKVRAAEETAG